MFNWPTWSELRNMKTRAKLKILTERDISQQQSKISVNMVKNIFHWRFVAMFTLVLLYCSEMSLSVRILSWALIFILLLRFPPHKSLVTIQWAELKITWSLSAMEIPGGKRSQVAKIIPQQITLKKVILNRETSTKWKYSFFLWIFEFFY